MRGFFGASGDERGERAPPGAGTDVDDPLALLRDPDVHIERDRIKAAGNEGVRLTPPTGARLATRLVDRTIPIACICTFMRHHTCEQSMTIWRQPTTTVTGKSKEDAKGLGGTVKLGCWSLPKVGKMSKWVGWSKTKGAEGKQTHSRVRRRVESASLLDFQGAWGSLSTLRKAVWLVAVTLFQIKLLPVRTVCLELR